MRYLLWALFSWSSAEPSMLNVSCTQALRCRGLESHIPTWSSTQETTLRQIWGDEGASVAGEELLLPVLSHPFMSSNHSCEGHR